MPAERAWNCYEVDYLHLALRAVERGNRTGSNTQCYINLIDAESTDIG